MFPWLLEKAMLAKVRAFVLQGIDAVSCEVEVDHAERAEGGKPTIVGLLDVSNLSGFPEVFALRWVHWPAPTESAGLRGQGGVQELLVTYLARKVLAQVPAEGWH